MAILAGPSCFAADRLQGNACVPRAAASDERMYRACGPPGAPAHLKAVVFDWAGTTVDHGCRAPAHVFVRVFARFGVEVTEEEAREPMGKAKRDHIETVLRMPAVAQRWRERYGRDWTETDLDLLYAAFLPEQQGVIGDFCDVIPGTVATVDGLRARGLRIGSTTGYTRELVAVCAEAAARQGYAPDVISCAGEVPSGRPAPDMLLRNMMELHVYPPCAVVKVGDTVVDVQEGLNAGAWVVAVSMTGNEVGRSATELEALPEAEREVLRRHAVARLAGAGAHFVVDSIADLPGCIDDIEARLARGERP